MRSSADAPDGGPDSVPAALRVDQVGDVAAAARGGAVGVRVGGGELGERPAGPDERPGDACAGARPAGRQHVDRRLSDRFGGRSWPGTVISAVGAGSHIYDDGGDYDGQCYCGGDQVAPRAKQARAHAGARAPEPVSQAACRCRRWQIRPGSRVRRTGQAGFITGSGFGLRGPVGENAARRGTGEQRRAGSRCRRPTAEQAARRCVGRRGRRSAGHVIAGLS